MLSASLRFLLLLPEAALAVPASCAQSAQPASARVGSANALLEAASQANGLHGNNLHPWHMHASWEILRQSKTTDEGSFEEWWQSPQQAKVDVSANGFHQTRYLTSAGPVYTGSAVPPDNVVNLIEEAIHLPLPSAALPLHQTSVTEGGVALTCLSRPQPKPADAGPAGSLSSAYSACFAGSPPALRMEAGFAVQALFNSLVLFEDHYLARDIRLNLPSGEQIAIHFDVIQALDPTPESFFAPPADAQPLPAIIELPEDVLLPTRVSGHRPLYPFAARIEMIQGTVVLDALIRKDGSIGDLKVVSSPPLLGQAALVGVHTWRYRPYLVNGQPVEVETHVHVTFSCDGGPNLCSFRDQN